MGFNEDLSIVLKFEGGYANNPADPGGATNFGVIQKTYDEFRLSHGLEVKNVKEINDSEVRAIYEGFYKSCSADKVAEYNPRLATQLFDFAINAGTSQAIRTLQKTIGVNVDGIFGPKTLEGIKDDYTRIGMFNQVRIFSYLRIDFYTKLAIKRPASRQFLLSWISRVLDINQM